MTHSAIVRIPATLAGGLLLALVVGTASPTPVEGQSLLSAGGLGFLTDAPDARSRMLGGVGIGLSGSHLMPNDPAAAGRVGLPGISATMEAGVDTPDEGERAGRTRFPSFGLIYPTARLTYFATFSGFLNQEWQATARPTIDFGDQQVEALDVFEASGGISAARIGVARAISDRVSVGIAGGTYLGSMERSFRRDLNPADVGQQVESFVADGIWRASGTNIVAGVNMDALGMLRLAGSVTWSDDLTLDPTDGTPGDPVVVPLPLEFRVGGHGTLAPGLALAISLYTADWSESAEALGDENAPGRIWQMGGGLEWAGGSILGRQIPLAIGVRQRDLPFSFLGNPVQERAVTGGAGIFLSDTETTPLARMHVGMELGSRSTAEWDESFLRATVTLRLSGS